jgi:hypothetical protein
MSHIKRRALSMCWVGASRNGLCNGTISDFALSSRWSWALFRHVARIALRSRWSWHRVRGLYTHVGSIHIRFNTFKVLEDVVIQGLGLWSLVLSNIPSKVSICNYYASQPLLVVSNDGSICMPLLKLGSQLCCGVRGRRSPFPDAFVNDGRRTCRNDHNFGPTPATCTNVKTSIECLLPSITRCEVLKISIRDGMN